MPLKGIKVIEMAGLAPGPFCGMVLADFGASVIRIDRASIIKISSINFHNYYRICSSYKAGFFYFQADGVLGHDCLGNGKRSIALDLKTKQGAELLKQLTSKSDVIIDPFRRGLYKI